MSTKRPGPPNTHSSTSSKRRKPNPADPNRINKTPKAHPVSTLKSNIRGLTRLLANKSDELAPQLRIEKERALHAAQHDLSRNNAANQRRKMISRYHRIRFFDRKKAEKRLKAARKRGEGVSEAEVDVNYALYYPLTVAYVSLFPSSERDKEGEGGERGDPVVREMVVRCMAEGRLEALKNGDVEVVPVKVKPKKVLKRADGEEGRMDLKTTKRGGEEGDDDETGGGFFE